MNPFEANYHYQATSPGGSGSTNNMADHNLGASSNMSGTSTSGHLGGLYKSPKMYNMGSNLMGPNMSSLGSLSSGHGQATSNHTPLGQSFNLSSLGSITGTNGGTSGPSLLPTGISSGLGGSGLTNTGNLHSSTQGSTISAQSSNLHISSNPNSGLGQGTGNLGQNTSNLGQNTSNLGQNPSNSSNNSSNLGQNPTGLSQSLGHSHSNSINTSISGLNPNLSRNILYNTNANYLYDTGYATAAATGVGTGLGGGMGPGNTNYTVSGPGTTSSTNYTSGPAPTTNYTVSGPSYLGTSSGYSTSTGTSGFNYGYASYSVPELPPIVPVPTEWDFHSLDRLGGTTNTGLNPGTSSSTTAASLPTVSVPSGPPPPFPLRRKRRQTATVSNMTPETAARNRCPICQKQFKRPSSLQVHIVSHTGEKLFQCPWTDCGKYFSVKSNMTRHYKLHQREKK